MIHLAKPTVSPLVTIIFCCFVLLDLKSGEGWTDERRDNMCKRALQAVAVGRPRRSIMLYRIKHIYIILDMFWKTTKNDKLRKTQDQNQIGKFTVLEEGISIQQQMQ